MSRILCSSLLVFLAACGQSSYRAYGLDDSTGGGDDAIVDDGSGDADGDGLTDGEEWALGTDPESADSDGDTYSDLVEFIENTDPNSFESRIYEGFWPYYMSKDSLGEATVPWGATVGDLSVRLQAVDQFGQVVDLYDFAGRDVPVIIDVSTVWCGSCRGIARWISGMDDSYGLSVAFEDIRLAVEAGEIAWITVLLEDAQGLPADEQTTWEWAEAYPSRQIPVLADPGKEMLMQGGGGGLPRLHLLAPDMTYAHIAGQGGSLDFGALEAARAWLD